MLSLNKLVGRSGFVICCCVNNATHGSNYQKVQQPVWSRNQPWEGHRSTSSSSTPDWHLSWTSSWSPLETASRSPKNQVAGSDGPSWLCNDDAVSITASYAALLRVLFWPSNFHCHRGGWLPSNQHHDRGILQCFWRSFWALIPENCLSLFRRAATVIKMPRHLISHKCNASWKQHTFPPPRIRFPTRTQHNSFHSVASLTAFVCSHTICSVRRSASCVSVITCINYEAL